MAVRVADKIKQHGDADFFLIDAEDVEMNDGSSLEETLNNLSTSGGTTEGHTHDNKDMLDKIIYIDAYSGSSVDCSVFDNTTNDIYCINLKDKSVWNKLVDNAKTDSDFRLTTSSGLIIGSSSLELGTGVSEYYIFMLSSINTLVTNTHETTYSGTQYFITPEGNIYTRYIKKKIVSDSDTGTDTTTITYSDFTILEKEIISSKVTELTETSTDTQYPSAKAVYDALVTKADKATTLAGYGIEDAYTKDETNELIAAIDTGGTGDVSDLIEAINELEESKLSKTEADNTYTPIPLWESGKRYKDGDVVWYEYGLYKWIVPDSIPDEYVSLSSPSVTNDDWEAVPVGWADYANKNRFGELIDTTYLEKVSITAPSGMHGIEIGSDGCVSLVQCTENIIDDRDNVSPSIIPLTVDMIDYAVRSVKPEKFDYPETDVMAMSPSVNWICDGCGTAPEVTISLPKGSIGDWLQADFYSGETPTTLMITSYYGLTDVDLTPEANTAYSLYFDYGLISVIDGTPSYGWRFSYAAYPYNTEV